MFDFILKVDTFNEFINNLNPVVYKTCVLREVEIKNRIRAQSRWSFRLNTGWRKLYFGYKSKTFSILFPWRTFSFIYKLENKVFLIFDVTAHASDQSLKLQKRKMMRGNIKSTFLKVSNILLRILSLKFFQFCLQKQYRFSRPLHSCLEMKSRTKKMLIKPSDISSDFSSVEIESTFFRL